jgi:hypothetical protein
MRIRWPFTILWTVVCGLALWSVIDGASKPVDPNCFEYCNSGLASIAVVLIFTVWLTVALIANWLWSRASDKGD